MARFQEVFEYRIGNCFKITTGLISFGIRIKFSNGWEKVWIPVRTGTIICSCLWCCWLMGLIVYIYLATTELLCSTCVVSRHVRIPKTNKGLWRSCKQVSEAVGERILKLDLLVLVSYPLPPSLPMWRNICWCFHEEGGEGGGGMVMFSLPFENAYPCRHPWWYYASLFGWCTWAPLLKVCFTKSIPSVSCTLFCLF